MHAKGRAKGKADSTLSPDRLVMHSPFGVQGVSPLTQLANNMLKEQQYKIGNEADYPKQD